MRRLIIALFAASAAFAPALADDAVTLRLSNWLPNGHPIYPATKAWADDIEAQSGGSLKMTMFPSEQLGKAFDHYDMARDGIADITFVNPGFQPGRFPIIAAGQLPFVFKDAKSGTAAIDEWYRAYAAREMPDVHYCVSLITSPGIYSGRKKVVMPADIKGLKIRPPQGTIGQMVTLLGGTNIQASTMEAREVLERGAADGIFLPAGTILLIGADKSTKYHLEPGLYTTVFTYVMNKSRYDGLSSQQKAVIDSHCTTDWAVKLASPWADFEDAGLVKLRGLAGHEFTTLTPDQTAEWRKVVDPLKAGWAAAVTKVGADAAAISAALDASLAKYHAAAD
jgi:TRAP-type C4-dicarboxylate transport system substrate-binding protein